jgi:hypothetical protein
VISPSQHSNWQVLDKAGDEWDLIVSQFPDGSIYQTSKWAKHKESSGWQVIRLANFDQHIPVAVAQCLFRRGPLGSVVVWVAGGPIGEIDSLSSNFITVLKHQVEARFLYVRIAVMRQTDVATANALAIHRWRQSSVVIGTKSSLVHSLDVEESIRRSRCSSNWKRNLKRSARNEGLTYIWKSPDAKSISDAYAQMDEFKNIKGVSLSRSIDDLQSVINTFGDSLILVRSDDQDGAPLAVRGALLFNETAWDFIAVTTPTGRKKYASHAVFWALAEQCFQLGIKQFDLGGIDPVNNRGVYDFKKGTGTTQVDYLGEWETSSPPWFRGIASRLISRKVS